jgi:hypothetical protein
MIVLGTRIVRTRYERLKKMLLSLKTGFYRMDRKFNVLKSSYYQEEEFAFAKAMDGRNDSRTGKIKD